MRKTVLLVLALALSTATLALPAESSDVVVLLDTSESVFGYFEDIIDYVVNHVANGYLLHGDVFHLLTFSETSQLELSREASNEDAIRSLVSRLYLLLPFGKKTDVLSALNYLDQYVSDLRETSPKRILIITDGVHNPPAGSPFVRMSEEKVLSTVDEMTASMTAKGWKVSLIRVPFEPEPGSSDPDTERKAADTFMDRLSSGLRSEAVTFDPDDPEGVARDTLSLPEAIYPGHLGKKAETFSFPVKIKNTGGSRISLELRAVTADDQDLLDKKTFLTVAAGETGTMNVRLTLPKDMKNGPVELPVKLVFADDMRVNPAGTTLSLTLSRNPVAAFFQRSLTVILFILIVLALLGVIALIVWTLFGMSGMSKSSVAKAAYGKDSQGEGARPSHVSAPAYAAAGTKSAGQGGARVQAVDNPASASATEGLKPVAVKEEGLLDLSGKTVLTNGYVIPLKMKEPIVALKEPRKAKLEAEKRKAERAAQSEALRREARFSSILHKKGEDGLHVHMTIAEQNPAIGLRNVHHMKAGSQMHVGGGALSEFLVFVVRVPKKIATVHWDGEKLTFLPLRPDYFPDLEGPVEDCLGKKLDAISPEGFHMTICFESWQNPSERSDKMLRVL